jgi:hypothetical protein
MLKFNLQVRMKESLRAKCQRHPKFDPSADERLYSETGCSVCAEIRALQAARVAVEQAVKAFERRAFQWKSAQLSNSKKRERLGKVL